jgi:putative transposase
MPDHVHLFCAPAVADALELGRWVQYWKSLASRSWPHPDEQPVWQRDYWETQLRSTDSYDMKWEYVLNNPVRHGLVKSADDWPYAGERAVLPW